MTHEARFEMLMREDSHGDLRTRSIRAAFWTSASSFFDFALRMGSIAVTARLIIPEHFGLFMMVTVVTGLIDQIRELGLSSATVQRKSLSHAEASNLFWISVSMGLGLAVLLLSASPLIALYYREPRLICLSASLSINTLLGGLLIQHQALLTRKLRMGSTAAVRLLSSVLSTGLCIWLAALGHGYWALVAREISRTLIVVSGVWLCLPWIPSLPNRNVSVMPFLKFGGNLTITHVILNLCGGLDRFLLGRLFGAAPVATYRQAYQVVTTPNDQLLSPVYQVVYPTLSRLQTEPQRFRRYFGQLLMMVGVVTMPLSLFVAVFSSEVTLFLLGARWVDSAPVVRLLCISTFVKQCAGCSFFVLLSTGRTRAYRNLNLLNQTISLVGVLSGVWWGPIGLAIADVSVTYLMFYPRVYFALRGSPFTVGDYFSTLKRPFITSCVMGAALVILRTLLQDGTASNTVNVLVAGTGAALFAGSAWIIQPGGLAEIKSLFDVFKASARRKVVA
ncbi:MAG: lipopolysaccharide biosynthesis protein [Opitutaceae bacterium]|nr:lipopolysaccharide biosynthesis protein [Opitutaceae bacterium]